MLRLLSRPAALKLVDTCPRCLAISQLPSKQVPRCVRKLPPASKAFLAKNPQLARPSTSRSCHHTRKIDVRRHSASMDSTGLIHLVLVGDVHRAWDPQLDRAALDYLKPDAALFVGDFGEEVADLVADIAAVDVPKAIMLGNHDAWGPLYLGTRAGKVEQQLKTLGRDHVAYSSKRFKSSSGKSFSVVGGRPFSDGNSSMDGFTAGLYGPQTMHESAEKITEEILRQAEGDTLIIMAHNGPKGLGSRRHDPCGKDFRPEEGDYGDFDLRQAVDAATARGRAPALVTFGHMHQSLHKRYGAGNRNMVHIDQTTVEARFAKGKPFQFWEDTGIVFLNCAVVPRHKNVPGKGNRISHFVSVQLHEGTVTAAENVWIGVKEDGAAYMHASESLISSRTKDGSLERTCFLAFDKSLSEVHTPFTSRVREQTSKQEL